MRRIAIIGAAISANDLPALNGWELWSMNNLYRQFPNVRFSRWYELHKFERVNNRYIRRGVDTYSEEPVWKYMQGIDGLKCPVYMQRKWKNIEESRLFPFKPIMTLYGSYFGCSFAWMLAHALYEHEMGNKADKVESIALYGVNLGGIEYYYQRPSTEYMIGRLRGKGIAIYISESSTVCKAPYVYALDEDPVFIAAVHQDNMRIITEKFITSLTLDYENRYYGGN